MSEEKQTIRRVFHPDFPSAVKALAKRYPEIDTFEPVAYEGKLRHTQIMVCIEGVKEDAHIIDVREIPVVCTDDVNDSPEAAEAVAVIINRLLMRESQKLAKIDVLSPDLMSFVDNMSSTKATADITVAETKDIIKLWYQALAENQRDANGKRRKLAFTCAAIVDSLQSAKKAAIHFPDTDPQAVDTFIGKVYNNLCDLFKSYNKPTTILQKWYDNRKIEKTTESAAVGIEDIADLF